MVYGAEAMLLADIEFRSPQVKNYNDDHITEQRELEVNSAEEWTSKWSRNRNRVRIHSVVRYSSSIGCCIFVLYIIIGLLQVWTSKSAGFVKKMLR
jgi:hypothetical protein